VISPGLVALLLGSILFLGTIAIVFALTLRNQWQKMSDQDRSREP
jgi:hypothetical protein